MVPYQIQQALADQRTLELRASARRHEPKAGAPLAHTKHSRPSRFAIWHLWALVHIRGGGATATTEGSASPAGPTGCLA